MRIFSGMKVSEGKRNGATYYNRIPVRYADMSRMVAHILKKGSENMVNSTPFIACNIQSLLIARDRTQDPMLVDKLQVAERNYDATAGQYESGQGNLYSTDRYMPVPYNLTMNVDIWTGNTDQKMQVLEQILILFNPSVVLQHTSNPIDWTSLFEVELTDLQWSNRSIPAGVDETIDVATLTFTLPIWISPPAKVKRQKIINTIVTNVFNIDNLDDVGYDADVYDFFRSIDEEFELHTVSPNNYNVEVVGTEATLYKDVTVKANWNDLLEVISPQGSTGTAGAQQIDDIPLTVGSTLQLNLSNDVDSTDNLITGIIARNDTDPGKLIFTLDTDTLPSNTFSNITRIVDASVNYPGDGTLDASTTGQRYLLTTEIQGDNWGISASANDIIEYNGSIWSIVFDASTSDGTVQYVLNSYTNKQYKWADQQWTSSYEGVYNPGFWRINI
jgi:hypothetical protein